MAEAEAESVSAGDFYMSDCSVSAEDFGEMVFCDVSRELRDLNSHWILKNLLKKCIKNLFLTFTGVGLLRFRGADLDRLRLDRTGDRLLGLGIKE